MYKRDPETNVIVSTDDSHYKAILANRTAKKKSDVLVKEIDQLKGELFEIKNLLQSIINGNNDG